MAQRTVDIKISFPQFSCFPGREAYESFEANLEAHATRCDDEGWSIADCLFRRDAGAVDAAGVPVPTVPAILAVGGGTAMEKQRRLRRKRLKESHGFIMQHIANADFVRIMTRPPYLQDGPRALDYIRSKCLVAMDTTDSQDKKEEWRAISIAKDIGVGKEAMKDEQGQARCQHGKGRTCLVRSDTVG